MWCITSFKNDVGVAFSHGGQPTVPIGRDGKPLGGWPVDDPNKANTWTTILVAGPDGTLQEALLDLTTNPDHALTAVHKPKKPIVTILTPR